MPQFGRKRHHIHLAGREYHDVDYWDKLSPEEAEFMAKFLEETLNGHFHEDSFYYENDEERKKIWREQHARKRDLHGLASVGLLGMYAKSYLPEMLPAEGEWDRLTGKSMENTEDDIIDKLDRAYVRPYAWVSLGLRPLPRKTGESQRYDVIRVHFDENSNEVERFLVADNRSLQHAVGHLKKEMHYCWFPSGQHVADKQQRAKWLATVAEKPKKAAKTRKKKS